jgi:hypothetical protein
MLASALALAQKGMAVFPCRPRDKRPATAHGLKDATHDLAVIRQWWKDEPACNIGIATGAVSRVFAIDIDGFDAEVELRKLEAEHGALPPTVEALSARGRHLYFQMPEIPIANSAGKIAPGIDVRGNGGYVLAPPSVHPSGKLYSWSVDSAKAFAAAPDWLLDRIAPAGRAAPAPATEWRELVANGVDEGTRDSSLTRLAGHLLRRHVDPLVVLELLQIWNATRCRPPLSAQDVERICNSIAGRELKRKEHARQHN